jgi:hypothetical protein
VDEQVIEAVDDAVEIDDFGRGGTSFHRSESR